MQGGCKYPGEAKPKELLDFETHLLQLQMNIENTFLSNIKMKFCSSLKIWPE
jgi:hypothetical protein